MNFKKILALVLVVAMCLSMVPTYAFAEDVELWDEDEVAVQNDAPLEDEYIDEDPVTQEPAEEEPAATDPEEPAAEEPAAQEPAADTVEALGSGETLSYNQISPNDVARINGTGYPSLAAAVAAASDGAYIELRREDPVEVTINKAVTVEATELDAKLTGDVTISGVTVNFINMKANTVYVQNGVLSIAEGDRGEYGTVKATTAITGADVKGGSFEKISASLLADGYAPENYNGTTPLSGTVVDPHGLQQRFTLQSYTWVATRVDTAGTYYYTNDTTSNTFANAFGVITDASATPLAGEVTLLTDVTLSVSVPVPSTVTLDLKGHKITNSTNFNDTALFYTSSAPSPSSIGTVSGHLTIKDTDTAGTGAITATTTGVNAAAIQHDTGTLTIQSGTISGPNAIYMEAGTLSISGGTLIATAEALDDNAHRTGAAIYLRNTSINTATITISNGTLRGPRAVFEEQSGADDKITVTGGTFHTTDTTATKKTVELRSVDANLDRITASFSGGTYDTYVSNTYLKDGSICVKNTDDTYTVKTGAYVFEVAGDAKRFYSADEAADAVAAAINGFNPTDFPSSFNIKVLTGTQTLTIPTGRSLIIQVAEGAAFVPVAEDENVGRCRIRNILNVASPTDLGPEIAPTEVIVGAIYLLDNLPYSAQVIGAPKQYYDDTEVGWTEAVTAAKSNTSYVLKALAENKTLTLGNNDSIKIDKTGKEVTVQKAGTASADYQVMKSEGTDYDTYTCAIAVASYVDSNNNTVYTATFDDAATQAAEIGVYTVTLYKAPAFNNTTKDVYALGANETLTVLATDTDVQAIVDALEDKVPGYNAPLYKLMVTNDGEVAVKTTHELHNGTFTYSGETPVAKARLNTTEETYEYFDSFKTAVEFVTYDHPNDDLVLIPLKNDTFTIDSQADVTRYSAKAIRVDNSGDFVLKMGDVDLGSSAARQYYCFTETPGTGCTEYILKPAVAKIPAEAAKNIYYDVVPGSDYKLFASFGDAVEADSTAVIVLVATHTDLVTSDGVETFKLGIPGGPISVKAKLNGFDWLKVEPFDTTLAVKEAETVDTLDGLTITTYSVETPVASITTGTGSAEHTDLYATFKEAADLATYTDVHATDIKVVELLATDMTAYQLETDEKLQVKLGEYKVNITAPEGKAILDTLDSATGITTFSVVDPVASIGSGAAIQYYATFAKAATAAAGTETITLYDNATYKLGEGQNVEKVIVYANSKSFSATSGVANKAVHKDTKPVSGRIIDTYTLVPAVAYADYSTATKTDIRYYETFDEAANANKLFATQTNITNLKPIVLLNDVTTPYTLTFTSDSKPTMIKVNNNGNQFAGVVCPTTATGYVVRQSESGTATLYREVKAVASIGTGANTVYYATLGGENGAIKAAFAAEGTEPTKIVKILADGDFEPNDKYSAAANGSVKIDMSDFGSITEEAVATIVNASVTTATGIFVGVEEIENTPNTFLVSFHPAVASVLKYDGTYRDFGSLEEAFAKSDENRPVVLLANNLTYALATDTNLNPIYVDKNGKEFTVTKVNPDQLLPAVAIEVKELDGGITRYTAVDDTTKVVAYVNLTQKENDGEYQAWLVDNYVYYTSFTDAVKDANNGEYAIVLTRSMTSREKYVMDDTNEVLRVATNTSITANIAAKAGFELKATPVAADPAKHIPAHTKYTVASVVASVTRPDVTTPTTYHDLSLAINDAVKYFEKPAILTIYQDTPADFTYPLNRLDKFLLAVNNYSDSLTGKNFTAPEGYCVTTTSATVGTVPVLVFFAQPAVASVTDNEGEHIFATFTDAVDMVRRIENAKNYNDETKDTANPDTVITLLGNNPVEFQFGVGNYTGLKSLMIATNEYKPNLKASSNANFVEKLGTGMLGVDQYRDVKTVATINYSPAWATPADPEYDVQEYSSFADAATAAFKSEFTVTLVATPTTLPGTDVKDVYEMSIGFLKVDASAIGYDLNNFINYDPTQATIIPNGENVVLSFTAGDNNTKGTFYVDGSEAMIVHPGVTVPKLFKTFLDALRYQDGNKNLVITPLTEIKAHYTATPTDAGGAEIKTFYVDETNYEVKVTLDRHETVRDTTVKGRYDFVPAKFAIQSDDPPTYDQTTWEPIYGYDYYATLSGASEAAQNTAVIYAIVDPTTYVLGANNANEVLNIMFTTDSAKDSFNPTSGQAGYGVKRVKDATEGFYTYSLDTLKTITVKPGDWTWTGTPVQAIPRASIATFTNLLKQYPPTMTGYHVDYYTGSDGKTYATGTDIPSGYNALPTVMPENGLTLTPHYAPNQYWVVFRVDTTDTWKKFTYDQLITAPVAPTKAGNDFQGWFRSGATTAFDFAHTKFTADLIDYVNVPATSTIGLSSEGKMVLTAKFELEQHTVSFDSLIGVAITPATVSHGYGVARPTFAAGTKWSRTGYNVFTPSTGDWGYFDENGNWVDVDFTDEARPTSIYKDYTLVPKWVAKSVSIVWADGSKVLRTDAAKPVASPTDAYDHRNITKPGYRIDPKYVWIDDNGDFFDGTVPVKDVSTWIYRLNWIEQIPVSFFYDGDVIATINVDKNMPLSAYENLPKPEDETKAYAWTLKGEDYDLTTPVTEKITLVGTLVEAEPEEPDYSTYATVAPSLSLVDNINMNAYVTIKEDTDAADYAVTVTFNGDVTMEGSLADLATYKNGEYKLSDIAIVAAPQMNDPAVVSITYQGHDVCTADLTVRGYAEKHIEDENSEEELKDLLIALLDFGAYSQLQFNYDTDNLANANHSSGNVPTTIIPNNYPIVTEGSISSISGANPALTLVSDTTLNMYFAVSRAGSYQFKIDGEAATGTYSRKEYKVSLPKIAVAQLGDTHDFTVTSGNSTMTVTLAPLAYAYQHQSDVPTLGNVCKAVYLYYQAAVEYFG